MRYFLILLLIFLGLGSSSAQGSVRYDVESGIEKMQADYIAVWERVAETNGYRIQIMALTGSNAKIRVENEFKEFVARFPEYPAYLSFTAPYFKIRVGNFSTRLQAYKVLLELRQVYPDAYITSDKIQYLDN